MSTWTYEEDRQSQLCLFMCLVFGIVSDSLDLMDCYLPGSSVYGIFQARIREWVAISFSRGSSQPRDQTQVSCTAGRFFTDRTTREALITLDHLNNLLHFYISTCCFTLLFYVMEMAFFPLNFINILCYLQPFILLLSHLFQSS